MAEQENEQEDVRYWVEYRAKQAARYVLDYDNRKLRDDESMDYDSALSEITVDESAMDLVVDVCHFWKSQKLSLPELFGRVVGTLGEESVNTDELAAIQVAVVQAVSKLRGND